MSRGPWAWRLARAAEVTACPPWIVPTLAFELLGSCPRSRSSSPVLLECERGAYSWLQVRNCRRLCKMKTPERERGVDSRFKVCNCRRLWKMETPERERGVDSGFKVCNCPRFWKMETPERERGVDSCLQVCNCRRLCSSIVPTLAKYDSFYSKIVPTLACR